METTIRISHEVKEQLNKMKLFNRETYNDVIENMIEDNLELNERTKKEIEEARRRIKKGESYTHEEVGKMLGL